MVVNAYAAKEAKGALKAFQYELGALKNNEVDIKVLYCGVCHSDMSMLDNEWRSTVYPFVPGHEAVGEITAVGSGVRHLKVGQKVTIGGRHGGFADKLRVQSTWAVPIPDGVDLKSAGPLFCGGITVFSPLMQHNISPLSHVGVVGIGGLGHMALAFLKAWGCEVTAFSTSPEKEEEARKLGAHNFVSTHDKDSLKKLRGSMDMVLDTVNVELDWNSYLGALKSKGILHIVGVAPKVSARVGHLMGKQKTITASPTGSPYQIKEMLKFAARHQLAPMTEHYQMADVNEAFEKLRNGKPRYRIVNPLLT